MVDVDLDAGVSSAVSTWEADRGRVGAAATSDLELSALHLQIPSYQIRRKLYR